MHAESIQPPGGVFSFYINWHSKGHEVIEYCYIHKWKQQCKKKKKKKTTLSLGLLSDQIIVIICFCLFNWKHLQGLTDSKNNIYFLKQIPKFILIRKLKSFYCNP